MEMTILKALKRLTTTGHSTWRETKISMGRPKWMVKKMEALTDNLIPMERLKELSLVGLSALQSSDAERKKL